MRVREWTPYIRHMCTLLGYPWREYRDRKHKIFLIGWIIFDRIREITSRKRFLNFQPFPDLVSFSFLLLSLFWGPRFDIFEISSMIRIIKQASNNLDVLLLLAFNKYLLANRFSHQRIGRYCVRCRTLVESGRFEHLFPSRVTLFCPPSSFFSPLPLFSVQRSFVLCHSTDYQLVLPSHPLPVLVPVILKRKIVSKKKSHIDFRMETRARGTKRKYIDGRERYDFRNV